MFLKTITILKLLNVKVLEKNNFNTYELFDDYLKMLCLNAGHPIIFEIYKYERFMFIEYSSKLTHYDYLSQLSIFRKKLKNNEDELLNLKYRYNEDLIIFESAYNLDKIISTYVLALNTLTLKDIDDCLINANDSLNYYCFRKSYVGSQNFIEFKIDNFGLILIDMKDHSESFKGMDLLAQLNEIYGDDYNTKEILTVMIKNSFVNYHSLEIVE